MVGPGSEIYAGLLAALFIGVTFGRHIARAGLLYDLSPEDLIVPDGFAIDHKI